MGFVNGIDSLNLSHNSNGLWEYQNHALSNLQLWKMSQLVLGFLILRLLLQSTVLMSHILHPNVVRQIQYLILLLWKFDPSDNCRSSKNELFTFIGCRIFASLIYIIGNYFGSIIHISEFSHNVQYKIPFRSTSNPKISGYRLKPL